MTRPSWSIFRISLSPISVVDRYSWSSEKGSKFFRLAPMVARRRFPPASIALRSSVGQQYRPSNPSTDRTARKEAGIETLPFWSSLLVKVETNSSIAPAHSPSRSVGTAEVGAVLAKFGRFPGRPSSVFRDVMGYHGIERDVKPRSPQLAAVRLKKGCG